MSFEDDGIIFTLGAFRLERVNRGQFRTTSVVQGKMSLNGPTDLESFNFVAITDEWF